MINLGTEQIPINAATKTFAILAKRGAGKSYTGAVMAEEFYKNNIPFVAFDPIDIWWGLRFNKDKKRKGIPVVVFGLQNADIQLDRDMGREIARAIVKKNISCVISTFGMPKTAQRHLITEFSEELLNINNTPRHVFVEEAHEYVPQRVMAGISKCFNAVSNLAVMGRNRGIGVTLLNQRAATINKDVLTQIDTLLAFRNIAPQDRKALKEWVEHHAAEGDFEEFMKSLPSLPTGEGWIWSPEFLGIFKRIKVRERQTFHPDREKLGEDFIMPRLEQTDIQEFINSFQTETPKPNQEENEMPQKIPEKPPSRPIGIDPSELIRLKNEYESKLVQKDLEIREMEQVIYRVQSIVGSPPGDKKQSNPVQLSKINMWLEKLGNSGPARILKFLSEHPSESFSREQISLAIGEKYKTIAKHWIPTLKRNLLVKEKDRKINVNPEL